MDAVEEIKSRLSIEDIVGEYVQLKRAGRNFKGLSPFTNEKTASFMVSPEKQIWHDFSSGKGGDVFRFVMEVEGLDFRASLEFLARKAGIDLAQFDKKSNSNSDLKSRIYLANELATKFYQVQLTKNPAALEYLLKERAFSKHVLLSFRLGYSPNTGDALLKYLTKNGFTSEELQKAGLITRGYRGSRDMFRGRIMIPLCDNQGRAVGFTARLLSSSDSEPKYINTPQTIVYDKSRNVFGLHLAKEAIRKTGYAVVVEGNLDVIASHKAEVNNVVATAGTAITKFHLKSLAYLTTDIRLAFDQDKAGLAAAERAIPIASEVGINLQIVSIPSGKDPDELIRNEPKLWVQTIEKPQYAIDWLIQTYQQELDLNSATGKKKFSDIILPVLTKLEDPVEQDHYLNKISELIGVSKSALSGKSEKFTKVVNYRKPKNIQLPDKLDVEKNKIEDQYLALVLMLPEIRKLNKFIQPEMLVKETAKEVLIFLKEEPKFSKDPIEEPKLKTSTDYVKMLMLLYEALYQDLDETELSFEAKRMQERLITKYVKQQKQILTEELRNSNKSKTIELLNKAKKLDYLLKRTD